MNDIDSLKGHSTLKDIGNDVIGNVDDDNELIARDLYDVDDDYFYPDRSVNPDSGYVDFREKRAWEEINWKPPKRAWGIGKRAWEMLDTWKGGDKWKGKGKRNEEKMVDIPKQDAEFWPWISDGSSDDIIADDVINDIDRLYLTDNTENKWVSDLYRRSNKRNLDFGNSNSLGTLSCTCCNTVTYQNRKCCFVCKLLLRTIADD